MRISDWSSDVCSSDLLRLDLELEGIEFPEFPWLLGASGTLPDAERLARTLPSARGASARLFGLGADGYRLSAYHDYLQTHPGAWLAGASGRLRIDMFGNVLRRSEEHTSELQSLMRISYAVFCLQKK